MQHYLEITLLPNDDIGHYFLWGKLYHQLHFALATLAAGKPGSIGVCFPEYSTGQPKLGRKVRIFANEAEELSALNLSHYLSRLSDYCHISSIKPVPEQTKFALVRRNQFVTSPERLARRRAKRKGQSFEEALAHYAGLKSEISSLPYIDLQSESTKVENERHRFRLFIHQQILNLPQTGEFSCYGFSKSATVPWF